MRLRLRIVAIGALIIGGIGACSSAVQLVPAWQAAHGGGVAGTFTLTEPIGCDRYEPPRQRCGWFGDFRSDDGRTVRRRLELAGGLPPGAPVGATVPARDTGSRTEIFQADDRESWRSWADFLAVSSGVFLFALALLEPWSWRDRLRSRGPRSDAAG